MQSASRSHVLRKLIYELVVVSVVYSLYRLGRMLANGNVAEAFANAGRVWHWERLTHLPDEANAQMLILHSEALEKVANVYYSSVHFPAMIAFLLWMFYYRPVHYVWMRRTLTLLTGAALVLHLSFPLAPPRMIPTFGLVDTGRLVGPSPYGKVDTQGLANQFAAMPSLHVGWALVIAIGLIASTRTRWRWLWLAHPIMTFFVVVSTANHYWLDGMVAITLLAATLAVVPRPRLSEAATARETRREPVRQTARPAIGERGDA